MPANWRGLDWREIAGGAAIVLSGIWVGWGAALVMLAITALLLYQKLGPRAYVADHTETIVGTRHVLSAIQTPGRKQTDRDIRDSLSRRSRSSQLQIWLIGLDKMGGVWTWVGERQGVAASSLTVTLDPGEDPIQAASEAVRRLADLPIAAIDVRGWSTDESQGADFAVLTVETSLAAEHFDELPIPGTCHFVEVHPASLSPLMNRMGSTSWPDEVLLGVLLVCDSYISGGRESIASRLDWSTASELEQRTRSEPKEAASVPAVSEDAGVSNEPDVPTSESVEPPVPWPEEVVMLYGRNGEVLPTRRRRYPADRVLSWEPPERSVPNRY